jgi:hypothetical protein
LVGSAPFRRIGPQSWTKLSFDPTNPTTVSRHRDGQRSTPRVVETGFDELAPSVLSMGIETAGEGRNYRRKNSGVDLRAIDIARFAVNGFDYDHVVPHRYEPATTIIAHTMHFALIRQKLDADVLPTNR